MLKGKTEDRKYHGVVGPMEHKVKGKDRRQEVPWSGASMFKSAVSFHPVDHGPNARHS